LPKDRHESAKRMRRGISELSGNDVAVIVPDTEIAHTDYFRSKEVTIGSSGIRRISNKFGSKERFGREKFGGPDVMGDESAGTAALLEGQVSEGIPIVVVWELAYGMGTGIRMAKSYSHRRS